MSTQRISLTQDNGSQELLGGVDDAAKIFVVNASDFPGGATAGGLTDAQLRASPVPVSIDSINLPADLATADNQLVGNASLASIDGKLPDLSGAWDYNAGTSGTLSVAASRRVLQITAVAGALGATVVINGGQTITLPALTSIAIEPKGNLVAPSIVFTGTTAYFVEHIL